MKTKTFDALQMKEEIQAKLRAEYEGLSDEEIRVRIVQKLETSDDPVARKWREVVSAEKAKKHAP